MQEKAFNETEDQLLARIKLSIENIQDPEVSASFYSMEENIRHLSEAFFGYPSILETRDSGREHQTVQTLVETLFHGGTDHTLLLPTKVTVGRSFMIAKFNLFGYLRKLCDSIDLFQEFKDQLQALWETAIFSLLLEDVYQAIIERTGYETEVRRYAALDLLHLWDRRFDQNVTEYASTFIDLWSVRRRIVPVFGTMMGTVELIRLSSLLPRRWYKFLDRHGDDEEVQQAMEEFIFGLAYEDLCRVRQEMEKRHLSLIDRKKLAQIRGIEFTADDVTKVDPREMYRFYQSRTRKAAGRKVAGQPGPSRTLEELLLVHIIEERLLTEK
ncbi:MAG TPA: hypothetical protein ENN41_02160 [Sediminispirochaeta sp.]|nr:hypothetical protein [Sediminispirochaeta sp.]